MRAILMYHSIDDSGSVVSISPAVFDEHVAWLSRGNVRVLPLDELVARDARDPAPAVALTFDDGFANFNDAAARLADHGLPVTVFPVTGRVGQTNAWNDRRSRVPELPLLSWPDLERLVSGGVAVGAHTHTHPNLTSVSAASCAEEMEQCVAELRQRLGRAVTCFAYPYGAFNAEVERAATSRFATVLTTRFKLLKASDPASRLPRLDMYYFRQPGAIARFEAPSFARWADWILVRRRVRETLA